MITRKEKPLVLDNKELRKMIPFSEKRDQNIDNLLLDYFYPSDLSKLLEPQKADFNDQIYIQSYVTEKIKNKYQNFINNLYEVHKTFFPDDEITLKKLTEEDKYDKYPDIYSHECNVFKKKFLQAVKYNNLKENIPYRMLDDAVMHYCYDGNNCQLILSKLITSCNYIDLIHMLIKYGKRVDVDEDCTLIYSVIFELPLKTISYIYEACPSASNFITYSETPRFTSLTYATLLQSLESSAVLDFLIKKFPGEVEETFNTLLNITKTTYTYSVKLDGVKKVFRPNGNETMLKFLKATKDFTLEAKAVLPILLEEANKHAKNTEHLLTLHENYIGHSSFNPKEKSYFHFFNKKPYITEKIAFIEVIRKNIHDHLSDFYVANIASQTKESLGYYKKECERVLSSNVFDKNHEEYGVNGSTRISLEKRLKEINDFLVARFSFQHKSPPLT